MEFVRDSTTAAGVGACAGVACSLAAFGVISSSYSVAKSKLRNLPDVPNIEAQCLSTSKRQHVVFLLGPPFTNRRAIAKRLTANRHLAIAHGGPVVIEFDDCIDDELKQRILNGAVLSEDELDVMIDKAIAHVQQRADERPIIFSAVLPLRRWRRRFLLAFDERTVIRLTAPADKLVDRYDATPQNTPPASPSVPRMRGGGLRRESRPVNADSVDLLSLEAVAMIQCIADGSLRSSHSSSELTQLESSATALLRDQRRHQRMEASVRWLHEIYEDIEMAHHTVDASRSLHEVAKDVRLVVAQSMLRCSRRSFSVDREVNAAPLQRVGGVRTVLGVCAAGASAGAVVGVVAFRWLKQ